MVWRIKNGNLRDFNLWGSREGFPLQSLWEYWFIYGRLGLYQNRYFSNLLMVIRLSF